MTATRMFVVLVPALRSWRSASLVMSMDRVRADIVWMVFAVMMHARELAGRVLRQRRGLESMGCVKILIWVSIQMVIVLPEIRISFVVTAAVVMVWAGVANMVR